MGYDPLPWEANRKKDHLVHKDNDNDNNDDDHDHENNTLFACDPKRNS